MKLLFSLIIFFTQTVFCREIIVIEHIQNSKTALMVKNILMSKFQLPENLIRINNLNSACNEKSEAILQLCILRNGDMEIKKINKYVLENSFNVFMDQKE